MSCQSLKQLACGMSESTEIYICKPGQALTDGRVEYGDMTTKAEAEDDATDRLLADPSIGKIAYYTMHSNGDFKCLHTKQNPKHKKAAAKPSAGVATRTKTRRVKAVKPSLMRRVLNLFQ